MILLSVLLALRSGGDRYYLLKARKTDVRGSELFYFFRPSAFFKLLLFYVGYYLRKLTYAVLCLLPCGGVITLLLYYIEHGRGSFAVVTVLLAFSAVFLVNGIIYFLRLSSLLFTSRYLFAGGDFSSFGRLFRASAECVENKRGVILRRKLSLSGWFISCVLVFPVPFVQNYYKEQMAALADELIKNHYLQNG